MSDDVNHPDHYTFGNIEVWDALYDWFGPDYFKGNIVKYIVRSGKKGEDALKDLKKAKAYLDELIRRVEIYDK